jgi:hypothetical protein
MKKVIRFLFVVFLPAVTYGQYRGTDLGLLVDSIAKNDVLDGSYIYYPSPKADKNARFDRLTVLASSKELLELTESRNTTVKCAAFQSLCARDSVDVISVVTAHLYDTSDVPTQTGCIVHHEMTGDYFLNIFYFYLAGRDSSYFANNISRIVTIDSLIFYDPKIRLEAKKSRIKHVNGDTLYYDRVREIAQKERIPEAVLALAKFKRLRDREIIASYFSDESTQYYAIWAVREFPDSLFYPLLVDVFNQEWKGHYYDYIKWRILYQALAQYPCQRTLELFDKTVKARNKFRRETLGRYLLIAITKYPNPLFERYIDQIRLDDFHARFLEEEANAENR